MKDREIGDFLQENTELLDEAVIIKLPRKQIDKGKIVEFSYKEEETLGGKKKAILDEDVVFDITKGEVVKLPSKELIALFPPTVQWAYNQLEIGSWVWLKYGIEHYIFQPTLMEGFIKVPIRQIDVVVK